MEHTVELESHMKTIHIVLDKKLLQATDEVARRTKQSCSELVRDALRQYLRRVEIRALEERDREGYARQPQTADDSQLWEAESSTPLRNLPLRCTL